MLVKTECGNYANLLGCHLLCRQGTDAEKAETEGGDSAKFCVVVLVPLEERAGLEYIVLRVKNRGEGQEVMRLIADAISYDKPIIDPVELYKFGLPRKSISPDD